jgi:hypothetical protein
MEETLESHVNQMHETLGHLEALYSTIHSELSALARGGSPLRKHLLEFAKVDGALASYRALLSAMDTMEEGEAP